MSAIGNWLFYEFGASGTGSHYGLLSGAISDVGELGIIGGLFLLIKKYNCHQKGCWRWPARHELVDPDTHETHLVCARHHPRGAPTAEHLADVAARIEARRQTGDI
ncbi:MAG TPA: hypothetical protein VGH72_33940 [Pseudonocardia sp.]|jgi:hypothetical protein